MFIWLKAEHLLDLFLFTLQHFLFDNFLGKSSLNAYRPAIDIMLGHMASYEFTRSCDISRFQIDVPWVKPTSAAD